MITLGDLTNYLPVLSGVLFLALIGKVTRDETRTYLLGIAAVVAMPSLASHIGLYVAALISLALYLLKLIGVGR